MRPLLIVPTHWDSPFRGLDQPMRGTPYVLDNVRRGLQSVVGRARRQGIDVMMLSDQNPIALDGWFAERRGRAPATLNALGACARAF